MTLVRDLVRSRELLGNLVSRDVKGKYKRTALGQLWSLANPLAQMVIFTVVFSQFMRIGDQVPPGDPSGLHAFALFLMCGLLPWSFFANSLTGGMSSLVANENLIKKVWFPRATLPVASTGALLFSWSMEMVVLLVALLVFGAFTHVSLLTAVGLVALVAVFMVVLALFSAGAALLFSVVNVYFRDIQHLTTIVLQAWFYLTPVIYPVGMVKKQSESVGPLVGDVTVLDLYQLNPMERFVSVFRSLLYDNRWPAADDVLWVVGWTVAAVALGIWVFGRHEKRLAEVL